MTSDPKILKRLDDLPLYTRRTELYENFSTKGGSRDNVTQRHVHRMQKAMMIYSYGFLCRFIVLDGGDFGVIRGVEPARNRFDPWLM